MMQFQNTSNQEVKAEHRNMRLKAPTNSNGIQQLKKEETLKFVEDNWDSWFIPGLEEFIRIPNLTPMVDPEYLTNGLVEGAARCVDYHIQELGIKGLSSQTFKTESGLPLVVYIVEATKGVDKNVMVYGHLDK